MASTVSIDLLIGLSAIGVAIIVVFMFVRATSSGKPSDDSKTKTNLIETDTPSSVNSAEKSRTNFPITTKTLEDTDIEKARSNLRTLTLKQEILSVVMKRLFEAEDDGEITREERISLTTEYEKEIKEVQEELKKSRLIVSLNELESIREEIIKKFESTLTTTQQKIDTIIKELNIKPVEPIPVPKPKTSRKPRVEKATEPEEDEEQEEDEKEEEQDRRRSTDVEERLNRLKQAVQKEVEELDRLELED